MTPTSTWKLALSLLPLVASVRAFRGIPRPSVPVMTALDDVPRTDATGTALPPLNTTYTFNQLIDHTNPSLGTFQQRYWMDWEFYEPGGPIVMMTPGEANAAPYTGYLTNLTIPGMIAQQEHGATIIIEHRYFGLSNPVPDLSVPNLEYHTIPQAIGDLAYFAQNAQLPMPNGSAVAAPATPWVLVGGSYSGALTAWTMDAKPGVFKAGYASSAVVQAITDFWQYFEPIRQFMPQNCSSDVQAAIQYIDGIFTNGSAYEISRLKSTFNIASLPASQTDDAAAALMNNLFDWQNLQPNSGPGQRFFEFCDALETTLEGGFAGASGVGQTLAVENWGAFWVNGYYFDICPFIDAVDCLGTYNASSTHYTDVTLDNPTRSWQWLVCNDLGFYQVAPPAGSPSLVSSLVTTSYNERQCSLMFPGAFNGSSTPAPSVASVNSAYSGWNIAVKNLFFGNGQRDPWRDATVSADGLSVASTSTQPIGVSDGFHCSDLLAQNGWLDSTVLTVQNQGLAAIKGWLAGSVPSKRELVQYAKDQ